MYHDSLILSRLKAQTRRCLWMALNVYRKSAALTGRLHPITQQSLIDFLRLTNSYYSNLIEGHYTHPFDIERAIKGDLAPEPPVRTRQVEARVHVEVQKIIEQKLKVQVKRLCTSEFICLIHRLFYEQLPDELRIIRNDETGEEQQVVPGQFRDATVRVGRHIPPYPGQIAGLMDWFAKIYAPAACRGINRVLAAAASHHRLAWIHPFLDGNGRVARLFTDCYLIESEVAGYGLWRISRGFARHRDRYVGSMAAADLPGQGDTDGRGQLTQRGLDRFCLFFCFSCRVLASKACFGKIEAEKNKSVPAVPPWRDREFST